MTFFLVSCSAPNSGSKRKINYRSPYLLNHPENVYLNPTQEHLTAFITELHKNPKNVIDIIPVKIDGAGSVVEPKYFSETDIASGEAIEKKDRLRRGLPLVNNTPAQFKGFCDSEGICLDQIIKEELAGKRIAFGDVSRFFDHKELPKKNILYSLEQMEKMNLLQAELKNEPWSDNYWPIYKGILGARYIDPNFYFGSDFKGYFDYVTKEDVSFFTIFQIGSNPSEQGRLDDLSPSEKYDLLIGNFPKNSKDRGVLTKTMWDQGLSYYKTTGKVETWMGICHGWAPAAYMMPKPSKKFTAKLNNGASVVFYPSDIKSFGSYIWSSTETPTSFLGGRCNYKESELEKDPISGAIMNEKCFDVNPKNWHLSIVNQIGIAKRSFVIDATYDYEVWNQPIHSYSYKYFNPKTSKYTDSIEEAKVKLGAWDPFRNLRTQGAEYLIGIVMTVKYMVENNPDHQENQSNSYYTVTYLYDLELKSNSDENEILGGEWYSNKHPDFIWNPIRSAKARSSEEEDLVLRFSNVKPYNPEVDYNSNIDELAKLLAGNGSSDRKKTELLNLFQNQMAPNGAISAWIVESLFENSSEK